MGDLSSLSDLQLVVFLKNGDEDAFTQIYDRYAEALTGFAAAKLYTFEDSRDIIHDVFVKLWAEREMLTIDRNLKAYLFTLVRYRIVDQIRKNITREEYAGIIQDLTVSFELSAEQKFAAKELQQRIDSSLSQLSPRIVEIFRLSREQNLSVPQIAERLKLSEQTVKNQLSTALKHLRGTIASLSASMLVIYLIS
jgi:RNA polymerase sigma-70 factor (family 1)